MDTPHGSTRSPSSVSNHAQLVGSAMLMRLASLTRRVLNHSSETEERVKALTSMSHALMKRHTGQSNVDTAKKLVSTLETCDPETREWFLRMVRVDFAPVPDRIEEAIQVWQQRKEEESSVIDLWQAAEPPRQELFRRINMAPGGTALLIQLRAQLAELLPTLPELTPIDADLKHLLRSWFNPGFLRLERVDRHTPGQILQEVLQSDNVHRIHGWDDLWARVGPDRRCFGFFHQSLPGRPIIFVEIALTRGLPRTIASIIDQNRPPTHPANADTAVFYSINNCQPGLRGIAFGNFLIKQVTDELRSELPQINTFATLSPLAGFASAIRDMSHSTAFTEQRVRGIISRARNHLRREAGLIDELDAVRFFLDAPQPRPPVVRRVLAELALAYVLLDRRSTRVVDPIAHFHLSNGALLGRVNVDADDSGHGRALGGVMLNFIYERKDMVANRERYLESGRVALSHALIAPARRLQATTSSLI